jgi:hypothetical protein
VSGQITYNLALGSTPREGSADQVAHSLSDSLFWLDQEFEHTKFFIMHMPSPGLDTRLDARYTR